MRSLILCRERLQRMLKILDRNNKGISVRALYRDFRIEWWEVEQAEKLGWVSVSVHKPARGRPSTRVLKVSETQPAKYPPFRYAIPKQITWKHRSFAEQTQNIVTAPNAFGWRRLSKAEAYMRAYPGCSNRYAAAASASRLMKRTDVRLMIRWLQCELSRQVQPPMPFTVEELIEQLEPLGVVKIIRR